VNDVQIYLQKEGFALDQCVQNVKALALFCQEKRNFLVERQLRKLCRFTKTYDISTENRVGRRMKMPGEQSGDAGLTLVQGQKLLNLQCR